MIIDEKLLQEEKDKLTKEFNYLASKIKPVSYTHLTLPTILLV